MDNVPCPHSRPPQFVKLFISIVEKKYLNDHYVEFDFSMGTVLVIFSFIWTDNDLVCAPPPRVACPPFFNATITHKLSRITQKLFARFSWNSGKLLQTTWRSRIYNKHNNEILLFLIIRTPQRMQHFGKIMKLYKKLNTFRVF